MNTNLKIALLLGYEFVYYGWVSPGANEDDYFKVMDNDDYNHFAFNDADSLLRALNHVEQKYHFELEFTKKDNIFTMIKVNRPYMIRDGENERQRGSAEAFTAPSSLAAPTLEGLIRGFFDLTRFGEIGAKMEEVKNSHPGHYHGVMNAKDRY